MLIFSELGRERKKNMKDLTIEGIKHEIIIFSLCEVIDDFCHLKSTFFFLTQHYLCYFFQTNNT